MKIINDFNKIDINNLNKGDNFLLINKDDTFLSYQYDNKNDFFYKFNVVPPVNLQHDKKNQNQYKDIFLELENKLILFDTIKYSSQYDFFKNEYILTKSVNLSKNIFEKDFEEILYKKLKDLETTKYEILETDLEIYSYLAIKRNDKVLLIISRFNKYNNTLFISYDILNDFSLFQNSEKYLKEINVKYSNNKYYLEYINTYKFKRLECIETLNKLILNSKNKDIQNFCRLNILFNKLFNPFKNFESMDNVIYKLNKFYKLNIKNPIQFVIEFYGYKCYNVKNTCYIYDSRTMSKVNTYYTMRNLNVSNDISKKYIKNNNENLIFNTLKSYFEYYILKNNKFGYPVLFDDINLEELDIVYKEKNKFIISDYNNKNVFYRKFGKFFIKVNKDDDLYERYLTLLKLQEAE